MCQPNTTAFNGDLAREGAARLMALAEKQGDKIMLMLGHSNMGLVLAHTGDFTEGLLHCDQVIALYKPVEHRPLATRLAHGSRSAALLNRSGLLWALGYPDAGLASTEQALNEARETGNAASLIGAMEWIWPNPNCAR